MKGKLTLYSEFAYIFGLIFLGIGTAFIEKAGFGMSMVIAPSYIIHLKCSEFLPFVSVGMAQYLFEALLIIITVIIVRRFRMTFLLSFVTAVIYGFILDGFIALFSLFTVEAMGLRILCFIIGVPLSTLGIALMFRTYLAPEAYELFVKEVSAKFGFNLGRCKTVYDICSLLLAVILSFVLFGFGVFKGIGVGTIICALINGTIIGLYSHLMDKKCIFKDKLKLRKYFE